MKQHKATEPRNPIRDYELMGDMLESIKNIKV